MKKIMALILGILMLCGLCNGCVKAEAANTEVTNVAMALGSHEGAPIPDVNLAYDYVYQTCASYGTVSIIVDDGSPFCVASVDVPVQEKHLGAANYDRIATEYTEQILAVAGKAMAKTEEVDVVSAIALAARALREVDGERVLIIIDSGLSTSGFLDMSEINLGDLDVETTVSALKDANAIPDLSDIQVIWYGLGDVEAPQDALTPAEVMLVKDLWSAILAESSAETVEFQDSLPMSKVDDRDLPHVSPVQVGGTSSLISTKVIEEAMEEEQVIIFDETSVRFLPDSAQLADESAALEALAGVVEYMDQNDNFSALLVGTTAKAGTIEGCMALSQERANTVRELLIGQGIDEERIHTTGMGYENPWYVNDENPDGTMNEDVAPGNRAVVLIDADSALAQVIMN